MADDLTDLLDAKKIVTGAVSRALDALLRPLEGAIRNRIAVARNKSEQLLESYLLRKYEHARSVKSLVHISSPEDIRNLYVPSAFAHLGASISEANFFKSMPQTPRRIILGTAGAGKSFFMRYTFVTQFQSETLGIPLYVELRTLNDNTDSILDYVLRDISSSEVHFMREQLTLGLKQGIFTLLLDGLDELNPKRFQSVQIDICNIAAKYDKTSILVTTRPVDGPESWNQFWSFRLTGLDYSRSRLLVERSGIALNTRHAFLAVLTRDFYAEHKSFLEVPLLVIIMALVFRERREISASITTFYEDAYSALISRHDATKEYKRLFYCELERSSFRAVLNDLSARTYGRFMYDFSEAKLLRYIQEASASTTIRFSSESYLSDLITSVCMIVRDGFVLQYAHRSFQEYFCACFVCGLDGENAKKILHRIGLRHDAAEVMRLIREINLDLFEVAWLFPSLEVVRAQLFFDYGSASPNDIAERVELLLHIHVAQEGRYDIAYTPTLGRLVLLLQSLDECGPKDTISTMTARIKVLYNELDEAALERHTFELENPRRYPELGELRNKISSDRVILKLLSTLSDSIEGSCRELATRRRKRDASVETIFPD